MTDRRDGVVDRAARELKRTPNPDGMEERISGRVMAGIGAAAARRRGWGPLLALGGLAAAAALVLWLWPGPGPGPGGASQTAGRPVDPAAHRFELAAPQATSVAVVGDFNDWDPAASLLARAADGTWTIDLSLPAGSHRYAFVIDGTRWTPDPTATATLVDDFGAGNSMVTIPGRS